jgi:hypothetical protein
MIFDFKVTDDLWNITEKSPALKSENWTKLAVERLRKFEIELVNAMRKDGWDGNEDPNEVQWSFAGALFYSIILITTIGEQKFLSSSPSHLDSFAIVEV